MPFHPWTGGVCLFPGWYRPGRNRSGREPGARRTVAVCIGPSALVRSWSMFGCTAGRTAGQPAVPVRAAGAGPAYPAGDRRGCRYMTDRGSGSCNRNVNIAGTAYRGRRRRGCRIRPGGACRRRGAGLRWPGGEAPGPGDRSGSSGRYKDY